MQLKLGKTVPGKVARLETGFFKPAQRTTLLKPGNPARGSGDDMADFAQFHNQLKAMTQKVAAACSRCRPENDSRIVICGCLCNALLADLAKAKNYAEEVAYEAVRAEQDARNDGRTEHANVAAAARLLAYVWMDVATLGTDNLTPASKMLEMAIDHLQLGEEELARESCRIR